jgi:hypothetical protein
VPDDERAVRDRLAALEAEVKADAEEARARKQAALDRLRARRAAEPAAREAPRERPPEPAAREDVDPDAGIGGALELATKAHRVKQELVRKPGRGEKSWIKSGLASMALGPIGWLYAGSLREAIPATALWLTLAAIASKILPTVLLMPVLMVVLPLSGIAGVVYALQYNRHGSRQRLFDRDEGRDGTSGPKQLRDGG